MENQPDWLERREWFDDYLTGREAAEETEAAGVSLPLFTCPCCGCPTLDERRAYEICWVCWWEDDGQDDFDASVVMGGPNHELSLTQARENFARTLFYRSPKHIFETSRQVKCRKDGLAAFNAMLMAHGEERVTLWRTASQCDETYHVSRAVTPEIRAEMQRWATAKEQPTP